MGKGTIISHIADGQYNVQLLRHRTRVDDRITSLGGMITALETKILAMPAGDDKVYAELLLTSYEKEKERLEDDMPDDIIVKAWCADKTTTLTGDVGVIEVPGELPDINIQPGYNSNAVYDQERDGQLQPAMAGTPFGTLYNWSLFPAWQKHKPTFRYGTISNLSGDTCTVTFDAATSSEQSIDVNLYSVINNVPIDYMNCNGSAFANGDGVLVKFTGQSWDAPVVIGFKDTPNQCLWEPWDGPDIDSGHPWIIGDITSAHSLLGAPLPYIDSGLLKINWPKITWEGDSIIMSVIWDKDGLDYSPDPDYIPMSSAADSLYPKNITKIRLKIPVATQQTGTPPWGGTAYPQAKVTIQGSLGGSKEIVFLGSPAQSPVGNNSGNEMIIDLWVAQQDLEQVEFYFSNAVYGGLVFDMDYVDFI